MQRACAQAQVGKSFVPVEIALRTVLVFIIATITMILRCLKIQDNAEFMLVKAQFTCARWKKRRFVNSLTLSGIEICCSPCFCSYHERYSVEIYKSLKKWH